MRAARAVTWLQLCRAQLRSILHTLDRMADRGVGPETRTTVAAAADCLCAAQRLLELAERGCGDSDFAP
jgi:hypothetical protein